MVTGLTLEEKATRLGDRIVANNIWRQKECVDLIASENTPSDLVTAVVTADPAGRYNEHRIIGGEDVTFYEGVDFISEVERELGDEFLEYLPGATRVETRPISGAMANMIFFQAMANWKRRELKAVANHGLDLQGHLSAEHMGALNRIVQYDRSTGRRRIFNFPVEPDNQFKIDISKLPDFFEEYKPELVIVGKSVPLFREPVDVIHEIINAMDTRPILVYDMAHTLGLYGQFQSPLLEGADFLDASTHKTWFGTQRGVIGTSIPEGSYLDRLWNLVVDRTFPGNTSNHHLGTLLGNLMAAYEMNEFKEAYQTQVRSNAKAFAQYLADQGIQVEGEADGYTETHQVVINVKEYGGGEVIAKRLAGNNIITSAQSLMGESRGDYSAVRLGVQEMTRFGMKEKDFETLAGYMAAVIKHEGDVKDEVARFRKGFLEMQYTLEPGKIIPITAKLMVSMMPNSEYAQRFAENLTGAA